MTRRIVKIINEYDQSVKYAVQWRMPFFGWWFYYHDAYYGGRINFDDLKRCQEFLDSMEKYDAKERVVTEDVLKD
jgi:membrane-bound acyltransferase YfiQ involved in biofilm formation